MFGVNKRKRKFNKERYNNNRLHLVMAIIFLLVLSLIIKLFHLQVTKYDYYSSVADLQHKIDSEIYPKRGKIYIQDDLSENKELYPVATNKDFASVYIVPSKFDGNKYDIAEKFYILLDKKDTEEVVEKELEKHSYFSTDYVFDDQGTAVREMTDDEKKLRDELRQIEKEKRIKERKEKIVNGYIEKLTKEGDPYEPINPKVDDETLKMIYAFIDSDSTSTESIITDNYEIDNKILYIKEGEDRHEVSVPWIGYVMKNFRYYPESSIAAHILGFVRNEGDELIGQYGLEGFFNDDLKGKKGFLKAEKSADGNMVIIDDREYSPSVNGSDLILTINRSIQYTVCSKIKEATIRHGAALGSVVVMDPDTGAIIAMCSYPDFDPNNYHKIDDITVYNNPIVFDDFEPGSTFKSITMAAGIDMGAVTPQTTYNDKGFLMIPGWNKPIRNSDYSTHGGHGVVNMVSVLENSLNTGSIFVMQQIGKENFADYVKKFGFGEKTGIELSGESRGNIGGLLADRIKEIEASTATFGQGITATPLQMTAAYAAIANGGILMQPYIVKEIISPDGKRQITKKNEIRRVISEKTSLLLSGMLVNVIDGGHGKLASVDGYYVAGKTGTAQVADVGGYGDKTVHTFIGFAPVDGAKFVMFIRLDNPTDVQYSASSAAPLFGDIAKFIIDYYKIPRER